jgi:hypothetical protein
MHTSPITQTTPHMLVPEYSSKTVCHYELQKFGKNFLQATTIKVKMKTYEIAVAAVYCPPTHNIKEENFLEFFRTLGNKFIAGG